MLEQQQVAPTVLKAAPETRRIHALDGWRGVAIALVLVDHIQDALLQRYAAPWTQTGQHGVTIFFVLSGYLITTKLMDGQVRLKEFYVRRIFRLLPVAWSFLAVLFLIGLWLHIPLMPIAELRSCIFFYRNFSNAGGAAGHYWSLSVEEQFYVVWPCILVFAGIRRSRWIAVLCAIACACYRWWWWALYDRNLLNCQTQVRVDALLVGCLMAMLLVDPRVREAAGRWSRLWAAPALAALLVCVYRFHWLPPLCECLAIAALIATSLVQPKSLLARVLGFRPLSWLGMISYSLYIWQEPFMRHWRGWHGPIALSVFMPLVALISHYCIELPGVRLGHRLTRSPGSVNATALRTIPTTG